MRSLFVVAAFGISLAVATGCGASSDGTGEPSPSSPGSTSSTGETMGGELDQEDTSAGDIGDDGVGDVALEGAPETLPVLDSLQANTTEARTSANLNLRKSASTSASILLVIPSGSTVTLISTTQSSGFYNISYNGVTGWGYASYLDPITSSGGSSGGTTGSVDVNGSPSPANAIARAKAAVGFSYYWGGGAWVASGATSSNKGSCSGSCPSCTHKGSYGADCSGLVAKAWQFGTKALESNSHPYSTVSFNADASGKWSTVSRGSLRAGDALVYNSGGHGHIVIYEKGDGWGSPTVYECRGCSYGCVHDTRSFGSSYHGIRRSGF